MRKEVFVVLLLILSTKLLGYQSLAKKIDMPNHVSGAVISIDSAKQDVNRLILNDTIPPEITLSLSSIGDSVTVSITSNEDLYNGWLSEKLLHTFYNWDFYGLYTRLACDSEDEIHSAVLLYEYSNPIYDYYYHRLDKKGNILEQIPQWNGPHGHPILTDSSGSVVYIGQITPLGDDGVVDSQNNSHIVGIDILKIRYTKIDSAGNILYDDISIVDSSDSWHGSARIACDTYDNLYVMWSKGNNEICYVKSIDAGNSWSTTNSLGATSWLEYAPEIVTDKENNVHFIWMDDRNNDPLNYDLYYKKLYPNGMTCIDDTRLTMFSVVGQVWRPRMCIDFEDNIYIMWGNWFTKINGNLDKGGLPATNEEITLIEDSEIPQTHSMGRSKPVVDLWDNIHISASSGGSPGDNCDLFYQKFVVSPIVFVNFPDSTKYKLEMTGAGSFWSGNFTADLSGYYYIKVCGSDTAGNIGYADTFYQCTGVEEEDGSEMGVRGPLLLTVTPNPFRETTVISFQCPVISEKEKITLSIYDVSGRLVKSFTLTTDHLALSTAVSWDGKDDHGRRLPSG
ncbi:hypothetical protein KAX75_03570, partial [candidate division WOR-3 bacterium]|nr:hypothetical protein [candidate division WOR-3 bacterium]